MKWPYVLDCHDCEYAEAFRKQSNRDFAHGKHFAKGHNVETYKATHIAGLPDSLSSKAKKFPGAATLKFKEVNQ